MKWIKYAINNPVNKGTEEKTEWEDNLFVLKVPYSETALVIVKETAHNGEYTIEDDGVEETAQRPQEERISELEEAMELLLSGVTG